MFSLSFFRDLGGQHRELFDDDYAFVKSILVRTKNESEIEVTTEGELGPKGTTGSLSINRLGNPLSLDNLRIRSDGRVLVEGSLRTSNVSKLTVAAEDGRQEPGKPVQSFGKLGCELKLPKIGAILDVDVVNGPLVGGSILASPAQNFFVGFEGLLNSHLEDKDRSPDIVDFNMGIQYLGPNWTAAARSFDSLNTLKMAYLHVLSPTVTIGSHIDYRKKTNSQKLSLGADVKMGELSKLKAKIDTTSTVTASFRHKLSPPFTLTLCAEINVQDFSADSHKFGIGLKYE